MYLNTVALLTIMGLVYFSELPSQVHVLVVLVAAGVVLPSCV